MLNTSRLPRFGVNSSIAVVCGPVWLYDRLQMGNALWAQSWLHGRGTCTAAQGPTLRRPLGLV